MCGADYGGCSAVNGDVGVHFYELIDIFESAFEYALGDGRRPLCEREQSAELRVHIGGEAGVEIGLDICMLKRR